MNNTKSILARADSWLADYPDPDPILAAPDLIRDMRDYIAGIGWQPIESAPRDGTPIQAKMIGDADSEAFGIRWSERPVCMLGPRNGGFPPGWATDGSTCDSNLPVDTPDLWREYLAALPPKPENNDGR